MSIDFSLHVRRTEPTKAALAAALLREHGHEEFAQEIENRHDARDYDEVFDENIPSRWGTVFEAAGIYGCVCRPDENGVTKASQLVELLQRGVEWMTHNHEQVKKILQSGKSPADRTFIDFHENANCLAFVQSYLDACREHPDADVCVFY